MLLQSTLLFFSSSKTQVGSLIRVYYMGRVCIYMTYRSDTYVTSIYGVLRGTWLPILHGLWLSSTRQHYYKNVDLSRLETAVVPVSQPGTPVRDKRGCPFVPGVATGTKEDLLSRLVTPTGTKGCALAAPFVLIGVTNRDKRSIFFLFSFSQFFFYFNYTFAFQLNLCIGIQCVWSPLIYTYIYICIHISIYVNSFTYENV